MDTSQKLFREYILWRSKVVVYAAVFLAIFALIGLFVLVGSGQQNINRFGLILQLLGVMALVPDIVGKEKFRLKKPADGSIPATGQQEDPETARRSMEATFVQFHYYQTYNGLIVVGNVLVSVAAMIWMAAMAFLPSTSRGWEDNLFRAVLALFGFAWINLYMLIHIFRLFSSSVPAWLMSAFFAVDLAVSVIGMFFAALVHILVRWFGRALGFVFQNGVRRVLLGITLPCLILGLFFELLATFF